MPLIAQSLSPTVSVSPQISLESLEDFAKHGGRRVVSHRPDGEEAGQPAAAEVKTAADALGLEFVHAPVSGMPSKDAVEATARALEDEAPLLMFCRSGTRSTIAWALAMRLLDRADPETLRDAAARAGYDLSRLPL